MEIKIFVNNPWQENTVVLYDRTGEAVIIDCGCFSGEEERRLQDFLSQKKLKPVALLDTHLHIDHIFGNNFIKNTYGLSAQASDVDYGTQLTNSTFEAWEKEGDEAAACRREVFKRR